MLKAGQLSQVLVTCPKTSVVSGWLDCGRRSDDNNNNNNNDIIIMDQVLGKVQVKAKGASQF